MAVNMNDTVFWLVRERNNLKVDLLPLQGLWTEAQYLRLTDQTNYLIEFTDGEIEVLPVLTREHQRISADLYRLLFMVMRSLGGVVLYAPSRVQIRPGMFREPDLVVLLDEHDPRNQDAFCLGAALVVEIVSLDCPRRDLEDKPLDYAHAGIPEYWIVNPIDYTITVLVLAGDKYAVHGGFLERASSGATPRSTFNLEGMML